jgi:predicted transcriptional regulator
VQKKRKINSFISHEKDQAMSVRFNVVLSDDLNREIDRVAEEAETNKSEILRKALQLFLAAREGKQRGLKLGLVEPKSEKLQTEIIGL